MIARQYCSTTVRGLNDGRFQIDATIVMFDVNERDVFSFRDQIFALPDLMDVIRQWQAAERDGDEQEMRNAKANRDAILLKLEPKQQ